MKTKYIKVAVSERLPEKSGFYYTSAPSGIKETVWFMNDKFSYVSPSSIPMYWLEEVEDHEEEMNEVLEFLIHLKNHKEENGETDYYLEYEKTAWFNAECLLTKLKQQS